MIENSKTYKPEEETKSAIGDVSAVPQKRTRIAFDSKNHLYFSHKRLVTGSDWLVSHKEKGMSYPSYERSGRNLVTARRRTIYILPLDYNFEEGLLDIVKRFVEVYYTGMQVKIMKTTPIHKLGAKYRETPYGNQYLVGNVLAKVKPMVPEDGYCMLGITNEDIYPGERWNYVFGWAEYFSRVGVFSFARFDPQFYTRGAKRAKSDFYKTEISKEEEEDEKATDVSERSKNRTLSVEAVHDEMMAKALHLMELKKGNAEDETAEGGKWIGEAKNEEEKEEAVAMGCPVRLHPLARSEWVSRLEQKHPEEVFLKRVIRVMIHEIGHMYNCLHCPYYECLMNGFNSAEECDRVPYQLCPVCLRKLQSNLQFDVIERYKALAVECKKLGRMFAYDTYWYENRAQMLEAQLTTKQEREPLVRTFVSTRSDARHSVGRTTQPQARPP